MSLTNDTSLGRTRPLYGVTKLTGKSTYQRRSMGLKLYLKNAKSWNVVAGTATRPNLTGTDTASVALVDAWVAKDDSAKYDIVATINEDQQDKLFRLNNDASSKTFWDLRAKENKPTGEVGSEVLHLQFHSCRYVDGASMEQQLARMRFLPIQLASIGEPISGATFLVLVKESLPSSWDTITFILDGSTAMDGEAVIARITAEAERRELRRQEGSSDVGARNPSALFIQQDRQGHGQQQQQRKHGPHRDLKNVVCFSCNKKAHLSRDCRSPKTAATIAARKATSGNNDGRPLPSPSATFTYVFSIRVDVDIATTAQSAHLEDERWIVDSGAAKTSQAIETLSRTSSTSQRPSPSPTTARSSPPVSVAHRSATLKARSYHSPRFSTSRAPLMDSTWSTPSHFTAPMSFSSQKTESPSFRSTTRPSSIRRLASGTFSTLPSSPLRRPRSRTDPHCHSSSLPQLVRPQERPS
jgi:hypothetical protein